jgi:hypothetical protein
VAEAAAAGLHRVAAAIMVVVVAAATVAAEAAITADRRTVAGRTANQFAQETEAGEHRSPASLHLCGNVDAVI